MKYKTINGQKATKELIAQIEIKFPWLKEAKFKEAEIDIDNLCLIWKGGVWKDGVWVDGIWEDGVWKDGYWGDGIWKDGYWEYGYWKDGIWKDGKMWSNLKQKHIQVKWNKQKEGFEEEKK